MSGDEIICLVGCAALCFFWGRWYFLAASYDDFGRHRVERVSAAAVPVLAVLGLFVVLRTVASYDVRDSATYIFFYLVMGAAWLQLVAGLGSCVGFVLRDDWIERGNPAAAVCGSGLLLGGMAAFAGGNIGNGPGWWVVVFSAGLSTGAMFAGLSCMNLAANVIERITVGRDSALAVRTGAFLLMSGIIAGRAVAGDWASATATVRDFFATGWPLFGIAVALSVFEWMYKRTRLPLSVSGMIAGVELGYAVYCLTWAGKW